MGWPKGLLPCWLVEGVHSGPWLGARRRLQAGPRRPRCPSGGAAAHPEHWPDSGQNNNNIVSAISTIRIPPTAQFEKEGFKIAMEAVQWKPGSTSPSAGRSPCPWGSGLRERGWSPSPPSGSGPAACQCWGPGPSPGLGWVYSLYEARDPGVVGQPGYEILQHGSSRPGREAREGVRGRKDGRVVIGCEEMFTLGLK